MTVFVEQPLSLHGSAKYLVTDARLKISLSGVRCHVSFIFLFLLLEKAVKLVGGGSVINGAYPV